MSPISALRPASGRWSVVRRAIRERPHGLPAAVRLGWRIASSHTPEKVRGATRPGLSLRPPSGRSQLVATRGSGTRAACLPTSGRATEFHRRAHVARLDWASGDNCRTPGRQFARPTYAQQTTHISRRQPARVHDQVGVSPAVSSRVDGSQSPQDQLPGLLVRVQSGEQNRRSAPCQRVFDATYF